MVGFVKAVARRGSAILFGLAEEIDTAIAEAVRAYAATATPGPRAASG